MEIGMKVLAENTKTGHVRHTNTCYFTMVAIDQTMQPILVTPVSLNSELDKRRFTEARLRRERRLLSRKEHANRKLGENHSE